MEEKSIVPEPKKRLKLSIVMLLIGLSLLYLFEPFEYQTEIGWGLAGLGIVSIAYNLFCIRTGRFM